MGRRALSLDERLERLKKPSMRYIEWGVKGKLRKVDEKRVNLCWKILTYKKDKRINSYEDLIGGIDATKEGEK